MESEFSKLKAVTEINPYLLLIEVQFTSKELYIKSALYVRDYSIMLILTHCYYMISLFFTPLCRKRMALRAPRAPARARELAACCHRRLVDWAK